MREGGEGGEEEKVKEGRSEGRRGSKIDEYVRLMDEWENECYQ